MKSIDILNSICDLNIISKNEKEKFLNSVKTIASKISEDFINLPKKTFLKKHGHLRPNTYDITSLNYKEGYNLYFDKKHLLKEKRNKQFNFSKKQMLQITKKLKDEKINISANNLIKFIKESISHREYSKYLFTKTTPNSDQFEFRSLQVVVPVPLKSQPLP